MLFAPSAMEFRLQTCVDITPLIQRSHQVEQADLMKIDIENNATLGATDNSDEITLFEFFQDAIRELQRDEFLFADFRGREFVPVCQHSEYTQCIVNFPGDDQFSALLLR